MSVEEQSIEEHNRRELWRDVTIRLEIAIDSVEKTQEALDDLREPEFAELLQPLVDNLRRASLDAQQRVKT